MPMTDALGRPLEPRKRTRADQTATHDTSAYERDLAHAQRAAERVRDLDGLRLDTAKARKADTARVLQILSGLVREIEGRGVDAAGQAFAQTVVGLTPENEAAFDAFLAQYLDTLSDQGQVARRDEGAYLHALSMGCSRQVAEQSAISEPWHKIRWRALDSELRRLPTRRAIAFGRGFVTLPETTDCLSRIQRLSRAGDYRAAGAQAACLAQALCTSQGISPSGSTAKLERATRSYQFRRKGSVEISDGHWVDESQVEWDEHGRPRMKKGADVQIRQADVRRRVT